MSHGRTRILTAVGGRRGVRALLTATVATALVVAPSLAHAEPSLGSDDDELWYFEDTGISELHETATGEGVSIALLDSGVNPDAPALRGADIVGTEFSCPDGEGTVSGLHDDVEATHGTQLAAVLVGNGEPVDGQPGVPGIVPDATIVSYDVASEDPMTPTVEEDFTCEKSTELLRDSILDAIDRDVDLIVTGISRSYGSQAVTALIQAMNSGIVVVAGNSNISELALESSSSSIRIDQFNGVVSVENATQDGQRDDPVIAPWITVIAPGTGYVTYERGTGAWSERFYWAASNSPATAYTGGLLALLKSAYPEATGDQLIQALVRGADGGNPDLVRTDENGYGFVSPRTMMATDPTTFVDENPLLRDEPGTWPLLQDFEDGIFTDGTWDYPLDGDGSAQATQEGAGEESPLPAGIFVILGLLAAAAVLGVVVVVILLARRRRR
ncbi:S8 family peptidase [Homoserinibacter sp. YIM 151385]|uniref:S8 family peptidase n=1 Tax=Homoserinibacter sp. YIM 151385 TaxID=2985506 RepID=UPI0022EFFF9E|nr:S8 family serine peptidase [Homoserinibacter sp. YIM 151385]WBU38815.1 S8 family serine peptidase [Homoserinibacter sp. YIM 151385]